MCEVMRSLLLVLAATTYGARFCLLELELEDIGDTHAVPKLLALKVAVERVAIDV
jgi:hypothetical protein